MQAWTRRKGEKEIGGWLSWCNSLIWTHWTLSGPPVTAGKLGDPGKQTREGDKHGGGERKVKTCLEMLNCSPLRHRPPDLHSRDAHIKRESSQKGQKHYLCKDAKCRHECWPMHWKCTVPMNILNVRYCVSVVATNLSVYCDIKGVSNTVS